MTTEFLDKFFSFVKIYNYTNVQMYIFVLVLKGENMGNDEGEKTC